MPFNVEEVVILELFDMTAEEKIGAHKLVNQMLDTVECKICLLDNDQNVLRIENYGLTDEEDAIFMEYLRTMIEGGPIVDESQVCS